MGKEVAPPWGLTLHIFTEAKPLSVSRQVPPCDFFSQFNMKTVESGFDPEPS